MKLGYELTIEQTQKLSMTPELIQAIQILQYNSAELLEHVENELLENPILETESISDGDEDVQVDLDELKEKIAEGGYEGDSFSSWESSSADEYSFEKFVAFKYTLVEHLLNQLHFSSLKDDDLLIGRYIIEGVDDNGYLSLSVNEIADTVGCEIEDVERVLGVIHTFDPIGVGARDLKECLIVQLAAKGELTEVLEDIISNRLEDLAANRISLIAKDYGITNQEMQEIADKIKRLHPKPGSLYDSSETVKYVIPDIYVEKQDDDFVILLNDTASPKLAISSYYNQLLDEASTNKELGKYLSNRYNSAVWLIRSIEQRRQTILSVAEAIVGYQKDFFDKGEKYLKPLTLKQIAENVGIHESTVSRAINGKYMQCCQGVRELRYFFTSGVYTEDGEGVSSNSVKSMIKEIIDSENPSKPYSDLIIGKMLGNKGIEISRRTIAKYREDMGIPSSSKRRRF